MFIPDDFFFLPVPGSNHGWVIRTIKNDHSWRNIRAGTKNPKEKLNKYEKKLKNKNHSNSLRSGRQAGRPFAAQRCHIQIIITAPTAALIFVQVVHFVFLFLGRDTYSSSASFSSETITILEYGRNYPDPDPSINSIQKNKEILHFCLYCGSGIWCLFDPWIRDPE